MAIPKDFAETLESYIDKSSVNSVLRTMAEICREKAQHIDENWQDRQLARKWDRAADAVDKLADLLTV